MNDTHIDALTPVLDWWNLMTYEFALNGLRTVRHSSQLFGNAEDPTRGAGQSSYLTFENAVRWFKKHGAKPEQLVMGIPAYGRAYSGVEGGMNGLYGRSDGRSPQQMALSDVLSRIDSGALTYYWDDEAKAPYASSDDGTVISFDDARSVREKCAYINKEDLGGAMIWDMYFDSPDTDKSLANTAFQSLEGEKVKRPALVPYEKRSRYCNIGEKRTKKGSSSGSTKGTSISRIGLLGSALIPFMI